jgi:hypothetical protein
MQMLYRKGLFSPINRNCCISSYFNKYQIDMIILISRVLNEGRRDKKTVKVLNNHLAIYVLLNIVRQNFDGLSFCFNRRHTRTSLRIELRRGRLTRTVPLNTGALSYGEIFLPDDPTSLKASVFVQNSPRTQRVNCVINRAQIGTDVHGCWKSLAASLRLRLVVRFTFFELSAFSLHLFLTLYSLLYSSAFPPGRRY